MKSKLEKIAAFDRLAQSRPRWRRRNAYYYDDLETFLSELIPPRRRVMEIGCGTGELLARLSPSRGVGVDFSPEMVAVARANFPPERHPELDFWVADAEALSARERFDYVVLSDLLGELTDVWGALREVRGVVNEDSRLIVTCFNPLWEPVLRVGETLGLKMPQDHQNWLSLDDISNLLALTGFEVVKKGYRQLLPIRVPVLNFFVRRCIAPLPGINRLGLLSYIVARPQRAAAEIEKELSVTVVVPCRNERGNIDNIVERVPEMGTHTEILFVDGNSNDGTVEAIEAAIVRCVGKRDLKLIHQVPPDSTDGAGHGRMLKLGKGDAVRKGFEAATGDVLMILDADLTVPPEELPRFYLALVEGHGDFVNGSRLVYPMEAEAMRSLNKMANGVFGRLFSWLLGQRIKDTLCGTKVLRKRDYARLAAGRAYFGNFDPFGDFDLLFGASKQNLKIVEMPIRYRERTYGEVKIERFKHGLLLLRMSWLAMKKLKLR